MTIALCLSCGGTKVGAFSSCPHCDFKPTSEEELTKSLVMSDHHRTVQQLGQAGDRIKQGQELDFDEYELKAHWVSDARVTEARKIARANCLGCLVKLIFAIAAGAAAIYVVVLLCRG